MPNTCTINSIDKAKGHVSVTFSIDGKTQVMGDAPLSSVAELQAFLEAYGVKYAQSLALSTAREAAPEVDSLVGETFALPTK